MATSIAELKQSQQAVVHSKPKDFPGMLKAYLPEIARALPRHLNPDRVARIALTCFRMVPKLAECDPASVFAAVIQSSQLGLEPGLMGEAHLIPFKNGRTGKYECQMIPGYGGLLKLVMQSGLVLSLDVQVVYERDEFDMTLGFHQTVTHKPYLKGERGMPWLVYGVARIKGSDIPAFDFMTKDQVHAIRNKSQGYRTALKFNKKDNPWIDPDTEPEMWRKTMIRRMCKRLPKSAELATALELDRVASEGRAQALDAQTVIEGSWVPADTDDDGMQSKQPGTDDASTAPAAQNRSEAKKEKPSGDQRQSQQGEFVPPSKDEIVKKIRAAKAVEDCQSALGDATGRDDLSAADAREIQTAYRNRVELLEPPAAEPTGAASRDGFE